MGNRVGWLSLLLMPLVLWTGCRPQVQAGRPLEPIPAGPARRRLKERIDAIVRPYVSSPNNVGVVVGVIKDGGTLTAGYGRMRFKGATAPDGSTIFEIGSMTKVFTATLLAEMAAAGMVSLDDPVEKLLPASASVPKYQGTRISLLHLAAHTSGLPRLPDNLAAAPQDMRNPYASYTAERMYAFLAKHELRRSPGLKYEYSNLGGGLLGHSLSLKCGTTYEKAVTSRICRKLGMQDTLVTLSEQQKKRLAQPHMFLGMPAGYWDFDALAGAGALRSTADDILKFLAANLGVPKTGLSDVMKACHVIRAKTDVEGLSVCLAWHVVEIGNGKSQALWHNGGTGGFRSWMGFVKESGTAAVVLSNSANDVDLIGLGILEMLNDTGAGGEDSRAAQGSRGGG